MSDTPQPTQFIPPARPVCPPPPPVNCHVLPPKKRSLFAKFCSAIGVSIFLLSIVMNIYMAMALAMMSGVEFDTTSIREGSKDQIVAVYNINGIINAGACGDFETFCKNVKDDKNVKAVVLRVNSPGGSVSASDDIYNRILDLKEAGKIVVVSMGGVAASGGYYISAPADEIYAEPSTITGSIGVIAQVPNLEGTLYKIGMSMLTLKSTHSKAWKDQMSCFREPQSYEIKHIVSILDKMQQRFENIVTQGRGDRLKPTDEPYDLEVTLQDGKTKAIKKSSMAPFNGNIYIGQAALELGLVDEIGYLDDACDGAGKLAKLDDPKVVRYKKHKSALGRLMGAAGPDLNISAEMIDKIQTPRMMMIWKLN